MSLVSQYGNKLNLTKEELFVKVNKLSSIELEIYMLLLEGCTLEEISRVMGTSLVELQEYQFVIFSRLEVQSSAELIINYREII